MFYFSGTRKPDFKNISQDIYTDYWQSRDFKLRDKLMEREIIFFDWIKPNSKVLSIGCGNSRLLLDLKEKRNCQVFGLDIENRVVEELNKIGIKGVMADVSKEEFDLKKYFEETRFDYIILSEFLEHLAVPEVLMEKIKDSTENFLISVPNSAFYRYRAGLMFGGRFFTQWAKHPSEHLRFWSCKDFKDWLIARGFKILKIKSSNGPKFLRDFWPNLFGHQICYRSTKINEAN
jgi:methionine biosynthesis protein MetW